jgi:hypothetical protein
MATTESYKVFLDQSKEYLDTRMEITTLKLVDKSVEVVSSIVSYNPHRSRRFHIPEFF